MRAAFTLLAVLFSLIARDSIAQDALLEHRVAALRGLPAASVVYRLNIVKKLVERTELSDMVEVGLARSVPTLSLVDSSKSKAWLEINVITTELGLSVILNLHRWVTIQDTGEEVFAPVWSDMRASFGYPSRTALQETLDGVLTSFGADLLRANRPLAK